jgi:Protein of unknown function (DUF3987)
VSWLDSLVEETDFVETPKQWIYWSGLATISAITSPNIVVYKGAYELKPNLYVLLVGRSGLGKGFGPAVARKLVSNVNNTRVITGRGSIEGIVKELSIVKANQNGSIPFKDARGFLCSGEFASSLYEAKHALTILMDLYDGHYNPTWDNTLKNSPVEILRQPCLTLLSGVNQDMFDLTVDKSHRGGGFIGRTLLINADKRFRANSMIYAEGDIPDRVDYDRLLPHLKEISKLSGIMAWTRSAKETYDSWFYPYREAEVDDKTGTYDRMNDHIIKVATCISLARTTDMRLEPRDIEDAIALCSSLSNTARQVAGMQGKSQITLAIKSFLIVMFQAPNYELTRKQVLQKGFGEFDSSELDKIIETMSQTGFITQSGGNKEIKYKLTKRCIDWWKQNTKGD